MHATRLPARYRADDRLEAVALPYGDGGFELVTVLPRVGVEPREALQRLASGPTWLAGRRFRPVVGSLAMPRLNLETEASLFPALRALGLESALDDAQAFAGIAAPAPMLSRVLHRTMLVLDGPGTEAAVATAAVVTTRAAVVGPETFEMRVDRPFALAVRLPRECRLSLARDRRHSQATALLRGGASLEVIASLLRHASLNTTMIYAKTDTVMLREVAQPWVGGGAQ